MNQIESILYGIAKLPPKKQLEAIHFIQSLNPKSREIRLAIARETAGSLSGPEGDEFERAVFEAGAGLNGESQ